MSADNPYRPPDEEVNFIDPLLHARMNVTFHLTEDDLRLAIGQYVKEYPLLAFGGIVSLFAPVVILGYADTFYGYEPDIPVWLGTGMLMAGSFAAWYLMSVPIRILTNRAVRADAALCLGVKTVTLESDSIKVEFGASLTEYPLQEIFLRGMDRGNMVLEVVRHRILVIPNHAFHSTAHRALFQKSLKKRLRQFTVSRFLSIR